MRFLKRLIISVLVYIGVYLPFIAVLQAVSGGDYTAAYSVGGIVSAVELALGSVIKITENKSIKKYPFINRKELRVCLKDIKRTKCYNFIIPKSYCYDGASIPRAFWRIIGSNTDNTFLIAALVHDVLCENHKFIDCDKNFSTEVFNALLEASSVCAIKRCLMKHSVNFYQNFCKWNSKEFSHGDI